MIPVDQRSCASVTRFRLLVSLVKPALGTPLFKFSSTNPTPPRTVCGLIKSKAPALFIPSPTVLENGVLHFLLETLCRIISKPVVSIVGHSSSEGNTMVTCAARLTHAVLQLSANLSDAEDTKFGSWTTPPVSSVLIFSCNIHCSMLDKRKFSRSGGRVTLRGIPA